jgi:hypothetical protein
MPDFEHTDDLEAKHEQNRQERLEGIKRWVQYIRENPPEVWGEEQNTLVDTQLQSARESDLSVEHQRSIRAFAETESDETDPGE